MAYYYIKSGGTGSGDTGRFASAQTGSFATIGSSNYYPSASAALAATTAPASGDYLCFSDAHDHEYGANTSNAVGNLNLVCVQDLNCDVLSSGAIERATSGAYDLTFSGLAGEIIRAIGISFKAGDNCVVAGNTSNVSTYLKNCTVECTGASVVDLLLAGGSGDSSYIWMEDTDIRLPNSSSANSSLRVGGGIQVFWKGGSLLSNANNALNVFSTNAAGGHYIECDGVDFTNMAANGYLMNNVDATADDMSLVKYFNCIINSDVSLNSSTPMAETYHRAEAYGCGNGDQYYSVKIEDYYGRIDDETTIFRTAALDYEGSSGISYKVRSNSNCVEGMEGVKFRLGAKYADLTTAQTITVYLVINNTSAAAATLDVNDVHIRYKVGDNTNEALGTWTVAQEKEPLKATPTALTTDGSGSTNWEGETGGSNTNYYTITANIGAQTNIANGIVEVWAEVMKSDLGANENIYIDPDFTLTDT